MVATCTYAAGAYIRRMSAMRTMNRKRRSRHAKAMDELLVAVRCAKRGKRDCVALQWHDGAGELHVEVLSPAQSWPYLN